MFIVRMTHPEHGAMHVYEQAEIEKHEKLGWQVEGKAPKAEVTAPTPRKRGRPKKVPA